MKVNEFYHIYRKFDIDVINVKRSNHNGRLTTDHFLDPQFNSRVFVNN